MPKGKVVEAFFAWAFFGCLLALALLMISSRRLYLEKTNLFARNSELVHQVKELELKDHKWQEVSRRVFDARGYRFLGDPTPDHLRRALNPCRPAHELDRVSEKCVASYISLWSKEYPPIRIILDESMFPVPIASKMSQ